MIYMALALGGLVLGAIGTAVWKRLWANYRIKRQLGLSADEARRRALESLAFANRIREQNKALAKEREHARRAKAGSNTSGLAGTLDRYSREGRD